MKSKQRRSRAKAKGTQGTAPRTIEAPAFTEAEEAFFQAGMAAIEAVQAESFADLDAEHERRPSFLRRLLFRAQSA